MCWLSKLRRDSMKVQFRDLRKWNSRCCVASTNSLKRNFYVDMGNRLIKMNSVNHLPRLSLPSSFNWLIESASSACAFNAIISASRAAITFNLDRVFSSSCAGGFILFDACGDSLPSWRKFSISSVRMTHPRWENRISCQWSLFAREVCAFLHQLGSIFLFEEFGQAQEALHSVSLVELINLNCSHSIFIHAAAECLFAYKLGSPIRWPQLPSFFPTHFIQNLVDLIDIQHEISQRCVPLKTFECLISLHRDVRHVLGQSGLRETCHIDFVNSPHISQTASPFSVPKHQFSIRAARFRDLEIPRIPDTTQTHQPRDWFTSKLGDIKRIDFFFPKDMRCTRDGLERKRNCEVGSDVGLGWNKPHT